MQGLQAHKCTPPHVFALLRCFPGSPPQLMEEHGVGYSTTGLVAQMREQGFTWKQARARCCPTTAASDCVLVHGGSLCAVEVMTPGNSMLVQCCRCSSRCSDATHHSPVACPATMQPACKAGGGSDKFRLGQTTSIQLVTCPHRSKPQGDVTVKLAEAYGFCWGVERAVQMAYEASRPCRAHALGVSSGSSQLTAAVAALLDAVTGVLTAAWRASCRPQPPLQARKAYPGKRLHITNEIIHNPGGCCAVQ